MKKLAAENAHKQKPTPVQRFANVLRKHGFKKATPATIKSNTYIFERDFRDNKTKEEYYFDLAVYGWNSNFYVELDDPGHANALRRKRDKRKEASAWRVGVPVLRLEYCEIDDMSDEEIWKAILGYL